MYCVWIIYGLRADYMCIVCCIVFGLCVDIRIELYMGRMYVCVLHVDIN